MKIKATITINMGLYMDIQPEIEIEVPEGLKNQELVKYLHKEYFGLVDARKLEAFDENAPANIRTGPTPWKKNLGKMYYQDPKHKDVGKETAELDTEQYIPQGAADAIDNEQN